MFCLVGMRRATLPGREANANRGDNMLDRTELNRALAKAIAYKNCDKQHEAETWAKELVKLLQCASILK